MANGLFHSEKTIGRKIERRKMFATHLSAFDLSANIVIGLPVIALALPWE